MDPFKSFYEILLAALPASQQKKETKLCTTIALFRRFPVPFGSFCIILWNTMASEIVSATQRSLRFRTLPLSLSDIFAQFARRSLPPNKFNYVLSNNKD